MNGRLGGRLLVLLAGAGLAALACTEDATSPAVCPAFCPSRKIITVESLFSNIIERDSSFQGYVEADSAPVMLLASLPEVDSRAIFQTRAVSTRMTIDTGTDTTTGPLVIDSIRLSLTLLRRNLGARNVRLSFYRLPLGLSRTTTFADVAPGFAAAPIRVVNVDSLLAQPGMHDSITGDSVVSLDDTVRRAAVLSLKFDTTQIPFVTADTGRVALGIRVTADSLPYAVLGSTDGGEGPELLWYNRVDSAGVLLVRTAQRQGTDYDGYVFDPPLPASDSTLVIGGIPSSRALLRFAFPRAIRDSTQILRATLILVPAGPINGFAGDSFFVAVRHVAADFGAKSPFAADTVAPHSSLLVPGPLDTLQIEVTNLMRLWQVDTTAVTAAFLQVLALDRASSLALGGSAGATFTRLRLYSSRTPAFRPALRLTYTPRYPFGAQ
jgi:hypothetical protein